VKLRWRQVRRSIWFRPALSALSAVAILAIAPLLGGIVPRPWAAWMTRDAVEKTLTILASSMPAVAIFSVATMFSALQAAAQSATPRARSLMTEDRSAQNAISTFIGAFLFSTVGLIGITTGFYDEVGQFIVFVLSLALIGLVTYTLIGWIQRLSRIGGVEEAIRTIEVATKEALQRDAKAPAFGGRMASRPKKGVEIHAEEVGYVQSVDADELELAAKEADTIVHIVARPGSLVGPGSVLAIADSKVEDFEKRVRKTFALGTSRTFDEDPRFGLICLSEIASRALSPAVNDPGTAISVLRAMTRLLVDWSQTRAQDFDGEIRHEHLTSERVGTVDVLRDAFGAIGRDGAAHIEVAIRLQKSLALLDRADHGALGPAAAELAAEAFERSDQDLRFEPERDLLKQVHESLGWSPRS